MRLFPFRTLLALRENRTLYKVDARQDRPSSTEIMSRDFFVGTDNCRKASETGEEDRFARLDRSSPIWSLEVCKGCPYLVMEEVRIVYSQLDLKLRHNSLPHSTS